MAARDYCDADPAELAEALDGLLSAPVWPEEFTGDLTSLVALKNLTSELIGRFRRAAEDGTRTVHGPGRLTRYGADLVVPRWALLECALLKAVSAHFVLSRAEAMEHRANERRIIAELVTALWKNAPGALDPQFRAPFEAATDDSAALRVVIDQVASLTDTSATTLHSHLVGE